MKNRQLLLLLGVTIASSIIVFSSCRKINDATTLGADLIPVVDNINTFDTSISVQTFNGLFDLLSDSQRLERSEEFFLGKINNDPLFGGTDARMFLELKPTVYKFAFARKDSLEIDSVVLVLNYVETYGDTLVPQTVNVYEIDQNPSQPFKSDSVYLIRKEHFSYSNLLGTRTFLPAVLNDSVFARKDTTKNQLRIKLDTSFGGRLLRYDSTSGTNGAYASDSAFKTKFKGFALRSMSSGNAVMGFDLGGAQTKLAIYYRYPKAGGLGRDTAVDYFRFTTLSAAANYVERNHTIGEISTVQGPTEDNLVYIQNTPGSFARIKMPDLLTIGNRLIHRAELIVEQVHDNNNTDTIFPAPEFLYLDAFDPTIILPKKQFRTIPYDLTFDGSDYNRGSFGSFPINTVDGSGNKIKVWKFNISRYVQHVLTGTSTLYDLRLSAPYSVREEYGTPPLVSDQTLVLFPNLNGIVKGRVRVGGGSHTTQRMRLRLIYSKI
ncbi:MAG: DUF4270 family protein [Chitinophagales bacterium]|nr:DUF4270 family protein [Chitinophagales bacterium]